MVTTRLFAALLALSLVSGSAVAGKVYKWVDANGVTHYGEQPPKAGDSTTIRTSGSLPSDHEAAVKNLDVIKKKIDDDAQARVKKKEQEEEKTKEGEVAVKLKENCDQTRENLKKLQEKSRLQETLPNGEKKFLTEEDRQAKITENQKYLDSYCGAQGQDKKNKKDK